MSGATYRAGLFVVIGFGLFFAILAPNLVRAQGQQAVGACQQAFRNCVANKTPESLCTESWNRCMGKCAGGQNSCNKDIDCQVHCTEVSYSEVGITNCCSPRVGPRGSPSCKQLIDDKCVANSANPGYWQGENDSRPEQPSPLPTEPNPQTPQSPLDIDRQAWDSYWGSEQPSADVPADAPKFQGRLGDPLTPGGGPLETPQSTDFLKGDYGAQRTPFVSDLGRSLGYISDLQPYNLIPEAGTGYSVLDKAIAGGVSQGYSVWTSLSNSTFLQPFGGQTQLFNPNLFGPMPAFTVPPPLSQIAPYFSPPASPSNGSYSDIWSAFSDRAGQRISDLVNALNTWAQPKPLEPVAPSLAEVEQGSIIANDKYLSGLAQGPFGLNSDPFAGVPAQGFNAGAQLEALAGSLAADGLVVAQSPFDINAPAVDLSNAGSPALSNQPIGGDLTFEGLTPNPETGQPYSLSYDFGCNEYQVCITSYIPELPPMEGRYQDFLDPSIPRQYYDAFGNGYASPQEAALYEGLAGRGSALGDLRDNLRTELAGYKAELQGLPENRVEAGEFGQLPAPDDPEVAARRSELNGLIADREAQIRALDREIAQNQRIAQYLTESRPFSDDYATRQLERITPDEFGDPTIDNIRERQQAALRAEQVRLNEALSRGDLRQGDPLVDHFTRISSEGSIQEINQRAAALIQRDHFIAATEAHRAGLQADLEAITRDPVWAASQYGPELGAYESALRMNLAAVDQTLADIAASPDRLPPTLQEAYDRYASNGSSDPGVIKALRGIQNSLDNFQLFTPREGATWFERLASQPFGWIVGAPGGLANLLGYTPPELALLAAADPSYAGMLRLQGGVNVLASATSIPGTWAIRGLAGAADNVIGAGLRAATPDFAPHFNAAYADNFTGATARIFDTYAADARGVFDSAIARGESFDSAYRAASDYVGNNIARNTDIPVGIRDDIGAAIRADLDARGFQPGPWADNIQAPAPRVDVSSPAGAIDSPNLPPARVPDTPTIGSRIADWWRGLPDAITPLPSNYFPNPNTGIVARVGEAMGTAAQGFLRATGLTQAFTRAAVISTTMMINPAAAVDNLVPTAGITRSILTPAPARDVAIVPLRNGAPVNTIDTLVLDRGILNQSSFPTLKRIWDELSPVSVRDAEAAPAGCRANNCGGHKFKGVAMDDIRRVLGYGADNPMPVVYGKGGEPYATYRSQGEWLAADIVKRQAYVTQLGRDTLLKQDSLWAVPDRDHRVTDAYLRSTRGAAYTKMGFTPEDMTRRFTANDVDFIERISIATACAEYSRCTPNFISTADRAQARQILAQAGRIPAGTPAATQVAQGTTPTSAVPSRPRTPPLSTAPATPPASAAPATPPTRQISVLRYLGEQALERARTLQKTLTDGGQAPGAQVFDTQGRAPSDAPGTPEQRPQLRSIVDGARKWVTPSPGDLKKSGEIAFARYAEDPRMVDALNARTPARFDSRGWLPEGEIVPGVRVVRLEWEGRPFAGQMRPNNSVFVMHETQSGTLDALRNIQSHMRGGRGSSVYTPFYISQSQTIGGKSVSTIYQIAPVGEYSMHAANRGNAGPGVEVVMNSGKMPEPLQIKASAVLADAIRSWQPSIQFVHHQGTEGLVMTNVLNHRNSILPTPTASIAGETAARQLAETTIVREAQLAGVLRSIEQGGNANINALKPLYDQTSRQLAALRAEIQAAGGSAQHALARVTEGGFGNTAFANGLRDFASAPRSPDEFVAYLNRESSTFPNAAARTDIASAPQNFTPEMQVGQGRSPIAVVRDAVTDFVGTLNRQIEIQREIAFSRNATQPTPRADTPVPVIRVADTPTPAPAAATPPALVRASETSPAPVTTRSPVQQAQVTPTPAATPPAQAAPAAQALPPGVSQSAQILKRYSDRLGPQVEAFYELPRASRPTEFPPTFGNLVNNTIKAADKVKSTLTNSLPHLDDASRARVNQILEAMKEIEGYRNGLTPAALTAQEDAIRPHIAGLRRAINELAAPPRAVVAQAPTPARVQPVAAPPVAPAVQSPPVRPAPAEPVPVVRAPEPEAPLVRTDVIETRPVESTPESVVPATRSVTEAPSTQIAPSLSEDALRRIEQQIEAAPDIELTWADRLRGFALRNSSEAIIAGRNSIEWMSDRAADIVTASNRVLSAVGRTFDDVARRLSGREPNPALTDAGGAVRRPDEPQIVAGEPDGRITPPPIPPSNVRSPEEWLRQWQTIGPIAVEPFESQLQFVRNLIAREANPVTPAAVNPSEWARVIIRDTGDSTPRMDFSARPAAPAPIAGAQNPVGTVPVPRAPLLIRDGVAVTPPPSTIPTPTPLTRVAEAVAPAIRSLSDALGSGAGSIVRNIDAYSRFTGDTIKAIRARAYGPETLSLTSRVTSSIGTVARSSADALMGSAAVLGRGMSEVARIAQTQLDAIRAGTPTPVPTAAATPSPVGLVQSNTLTLAQFVERNVLERELIAARRELQDAYRRAMQAQPSSPAPIATPQRIASDDWQPNASAWSTKDFNDRIAATQALRDGASGVQRASYDAALRNLQDAQRIAQGRTDMALANAAITNAQTNYRAASGLDAVIPATATAPAASRLSDAWRNGVGLPRDPAQPSMISRAWNSCVSRWIICGAAGLGVLALLNIEEQVPQNGRPPGTQPLRQTPPSVTARPTTTRTPTAGDRSPRDMVVPAAWRSVTPGLGSMNNFGMLNGLAQIMRGLGLLNAANMQQQPQQVPPYVPSPMPIGPTQPPATTTPPTGTTTPAKPLPSVSITASPNKLGAGESSTLRWISFRSTACELRTGGSLIVRSGTQGERITDALFQTTTFVISCTGDGGTRSATSTVYVGEDPPPAPSTQINASPSLQPIAGTGGASSYASSQPSQGRFSTDYCDPGGNIDVFIACLQSATGTQVIQ